MLPLRNRVLLPGSPLRLSIGRPQSIALVNSIWSGNSKFRANNTLIVIVAYRPSKQGESGGDSAEQKLSKNSENDADGLGHSTSGTSSVKNDIDTTRLFSVGTLARVTQLHHLRSTNAKYSMIVSGIGRVRIDSYMSSQPYCRAHVTLLRDVGDPDSPSLRSLSLKILKSAEEILSSAKTSRNGQPVPLTSLSATRQFLEGLRRLSPGMLADLLVSTLKSSVGDKQEILESTDLTERLEKTLDMISKQAEMIKVTKQIQSKVSHKLKNSQREYYLREQLKAIQEELGEITGESKDDTNVIDTLRTKLNSMDLPPEGREAVDRELKRAEKMNPAQPEHSMIVNYLQWMSELPWGKFTVDSLSIKDVRKQMDADHFGLDKVKTRLIEFLAVRQLHARLASVSAVAAELSGRNDTIDENGESASSGKSRESEVVDITSSPSSSENNLGNRQTKSSRALHAVNRRGPSTILCLVGPPGVGKTSLGTSVATALGRTFHRMALGGVHDEAELRGHRRTYIGAMPGNIVQGLKKAGTSNPVFLLDEIDKLGRDYRGDPTAALLEILDPAQNHSFVDHYLNVPFDLSEVLFIATANNIETIPAPLRDRMEIIQVPGYTLNEKIKIARNHLLPRSVLKHALTERLVDMQNDAIHALITGYTREAGVRNLERKISALCRRVAVLVAKQLPEPVLASHEKSEPDLRTGTKKNSIDENKTNNTDDADSRRGISLVEENTAFFTTSLRDIDPTEVDKNFIESVLGPIAFESEAKLRVTKPGVATGMAWTQVGGELLFIEATQMPGRGRLILTGKLGEVMRESCQAALSWLKSNVGTLFAPLISSRRRENLKHTDRDNPEDIDRIMAASAVVNEEIFKKMDLHIHFPAGKNSSILSRLVSI